jgi:hypothetical protein
LEQREVQLERREEERGEERREEGRQAEWRHHQLLAALTGRPVERPAMVTVVREEEESQDSLQAMVPVGSTSQLLR